MTLLPRVQRPPPATPAGPQVLPPSPSRQPAMLHAGLPPLQEHAGGGPGSRHQLRGVKAEQQEDVVAALFGLSQQSAIAT